MLRDTLEALAFMFLSALFMRLGNIRMDRVAKRIDDKMP
jgi:hypothetical protein